MTEDYKPYLQKSLSLLNHWTLEATLEPQFESEELEKMTPAI